ncbi:piggyBac transposable element-derived protein 4-like [Vespula maculifrons]|uniref:PiggyBac transposable element-derived protein 4-like n=1 Tax=Vespula maculifrons TaxID=7453 RepID=A0ABD2AQM9_VESMC
MLIVNKDSKNYRSLNEFEKLINPVGTIWQNRKELPKFVKQKEDNMALFSTKLYKSANCSLTIYKTKQENITDQISRKYNVKSKSYRHHLQIFFNILD